MSSGPTWERWLSTQFPGWLLPSACRTTIEPVQAERFLERLSGQPGQLELLKTVSMVSSHLEEIQSFIQQALPELVRVLDSRTVIERRQWEGGYQGALDLSATLAHHVTGNVGHFVTRTRRRDFDLLENRLVRWVSQTLLELLSNLREAEIVTHTGWAAPVAGLEGDLRHLMSSSRLREVTLEAPSTFHFQAARAARHPTYEAAERWAGWIETYLNPSPRSLAALLATGALAPLAPETRFEVAVLTRLISAVWARLETLAPGAWRLEHGLVLAGRADVARMTGPSGRQLAVYYNQAVLEAGARDDGVKHYLGASGRLRPDITLETRANNHRIHAVVVEVKHSSDLGYLVKGFEEALVYRHEYAKDLTGWPKAILVTSSTLPGIARREHDIIAEDWERWPSADVVDGILEYALAG